MTTVTGLAGCGAGPASIRFGEGARVLPGAYVNGNYFEVVGIQPWLGRLVASSDVTETVALAADSCRLGQSLASTTETPNDTALPGLARLRIQHA